MLKILSPTRCLRCQSAPLPIDSAAGTVVGYAGIKPCCNETGSSSHFNPMEVYYMSFRNNGHKRDIRLLAGGLGMLFVAVILFIMAFSDKGIWSWQGITAIVILFLGLLMLKNANEY